MFAQFEEGNVLSKTRDNAERGDKSNENSIMPPLLRKEEIDAMDSRYESDDDTISTEMLEDICGGGQYHHNDNRREAHYKILDCIKQILS